MGFLGSAQDNGRRDHWRAYFEARFEETRKDSGVGPGQIRDDLYEMVELRDYLGHEEERSDPFSKVEMTRFLELARRVVFWRLPASRFGR
jgi:hypothetical protein